MAQRKRRKRQRLTYRNGLLTLPNGTAIFVSEFEPVVVDERFCNRVTDQRCDPPRQVLLKTTNAVAFYRQYDPARGGRLQAAADRAKLAVLIRKMEALEQDRQDRTGPDDPLVETVQ